MTNATFDRDQEIRGWNPSNQYLVALIKIRKKMENKKELDVSSGGKTSTRKSHNLRQRFGKSLTGDRSVMMPKNLLKNKASK